jgi:hypothetical protein
MFWKIEWIGLVKMSHTGVNQNKNQEGGDEC